MRSIYLLPILVLAHMNTYAQAPTIIPIPRSQAEQDKARKKQDDDRLQRETEQKKTNQSLKDALAKSEADKKQLADQAGAEKKAREQTENENRRLKKLLEEAQASRASAPTENRFGIKPLDDVGSTKKNLELPKANMKPDLAITAPAYQALSHFQDDLKGGGKGPEMVWLPAGEFDMGSVVGVGADYELPLRQGVKVAAFAMAMTEVTVKQYLACVTAQACSEPAWRETKNQNHYKDRNTIDEQSPITGVSWKNAVQYAAWLSAATGQSYQLPSEAQWEYACKAGKNTTYCGSNTLADVAWSNENSGDKLHAVATRAKNSWGLFDLSGNAWEWTQDCWHNDYKNAPKDATVWSGGDCSQHAVRGGSWYFNPSSARAAVRFNLDSDSRFNFVGFRVARTRS